MTMTRKMGQPADLGNSSRPRPDRRAAGGAMTGAPRDENPQLRQACAAQHQRPAATQKPAFSYFPLPQQSPPVQAAPRPTSRLRSHRARRHQPPIGLRWVALVALIVVALGVLALGVVLVGYAGIAGIAMPDELKRAPATSPRR